MRKDYNEKKIAIQSITGILMTGFNCPYLMRIRSGWLCNVFCSPDDVDFFKVMLNCFC